MPPVVFVADPRPLAPTHALVFWAEDDWARRAAAQWGFRWQGCDPGTVARVNSRRIQTQLEHELDVAPDGLQLVTNLEELSDAINILNTNPTRKRGNNVLPPPSSHDQQHSLIIPGDAPAWILKTEFGTAGRESRRGQGLLTPEDSAWADKRFKKHLAIIVEPRLDAIAEASVQLHIRPSGWVEWLGIVGCITRPNGTFAASQLLPDIDRLYWMGEALAALEVAERLAKLGYHGPLGIDAMRYLDKNGRECLRPIQDINARYTMGRLALGLQDHPRLMAQLNGKLTPAKWP